MLYSISWETFYLGKIYLSFYFFMDLTAISTIFFNNYDKIPDKW